MRYQSQGNNWLKNILNIFCPATCLLCGERLDSEQMLCSGCHAELPHNHHCCCRCALPLSSSEEGVCGACLKKPPVVDRVMAPFLYKPPLDHLLLGLKFNQQLLNGRLLAHLLMDALQKQAYERPGLILPVPLHHVRIGERGYNQAREVARPISQFLKVPLASGEVIRHRSTAAQSSLKKGERRKNVRGAFEVRASVPPHVAIVDDVVTTGSTVNELARVLKQAGAERVEVWACARVP